MAKTNSFIQSQVSRSTFGIALNLLDIEDLDGLDRAAQQILGDPLLLQQLTDRVYQLMQEDLARLSERGFGGRASGR